MATKTKKKWWEGTRLEKEACSAGLRTAKKFKSLKAAFNGLDSATDRYGGNQAGSNLYWLISHFGDGNTRRRLYTRKNKLDSTRYAQRAKAIEDRKIALGISVYDYLSEREMVKIRKAYPHDPTAEDIRKIVSKTDLDKAIKKALSPATKTDY